MANQRKAEIKDDAYGNGEVIANFIHLHKNATINYRQSVDRSPVVQRKFTLG